MSNLVILPTLLFWLAIALLVVRSVLAFLGAALWTWFLADLGWRAIATNTKFKK